MNKTHKILTVIATICICFMACTSCAEIKTELSSIADEVISQIAEIPVSSLFPTEHTTTFNYTKTDNTRTSEAIPSLTTIITPKTTTKTTFTTTETPKTTTITTKTTDPVTTQISSEPIDVSDHYYQLLSFQEQQLYMSIYSGLSNLDDKISIKADYEKEHDSIIRALNAVLSDHPELSFYKGGNFEYYPGTSNTTLYPKLGESKSKIRAEQNEIASVIDSVVRYAPAGGDYEKAKFVYDYVVRNTTYDLNTLKKAPMNLYYLVHEHRAVCEGYAQMSMLLLHKLGIDAFTVNGYSFGSDELHMWLLAKLDGEWYIMDPTNGDFDDPSIRDAVDYSYFAVTSSLCSSYIVDLNETAAEPPVCSSMADNYFVREGLYCTNMEEVTRVLKQLHNNGSISLMCADEALYSKAYRMCSKNDIFDYIDGDITHIQYKADKDMRTLFISAN